jgi:hypothetical protein
MSRPAGAIGSTPAIGRSGLSAARSAAQAPSEFPTSRTSPSSPEADQRRAQEAVQLWQHRLRFAEVARGAVAGKVEGDGSAPLPPQPVQQRPPGVGTVAPAVQEQQQRPLAVELERAGLESGDREPVLEEDGHRPGPR